MKMIESSIIAKITAAFEPEFLAVLNESHMHSVPADSETHFKLTLVTSKFNGLRQVQRHQAIYQCLTEELQQGVHALALHTFNPDEWRSAQVPDSPQCLGGGKHDPV
jgi:BolA family transcriptional regulator, general stress-responsive regulator